VELELVDVVVVLNELVLDAVLDVELELELVDVEDEDVELVVVL